MINIEELKKDIVQMREIKYMTYEDIANTLNCRLGYYKYSRQAIFGLYKRYKEKIELKNTLGPEIFDVINLYIRTGSVNGVIIGVTTLGYDLTYYAISQAIEDNAEIIQMLKEELREIAYECVETGDTPEEIKNRLNYRGVHCSSKVYDELIYYAYKRKIVDEIEKLVCESVMYTSNKKIGKDILAEFNIQDSFTVVLNRHTKTSKIAYKI